MWRKRMIQLSLAFLIETFANGQNGSVCRCITLQRTMQCQQVKSRNVFAQIHASCLFSYLLGTLDHLISYTIKFVVCFFLLILIKAFIIQVEQFLFQKNFCDYIGNNLPNMFKWSNHRDLPDMRPCLSPRAFAGASSQLNCQPMGARLATVARSDWSRDAGVVGQQCHGCW